jgi:putative FmdB family regulatory protein
MPTYEYKCPICQDKIELFHAIIDTPRISCKECETTMNKGFGGGVGVHFKGSGFYETDYKNK